MPQRRGIAVGIAVVMVMLGAAGLARAEGVTIRVDEETGSAFRCERANFAAARDGDFGGANGQVACPSISSALGIAEGGDTIRVAEGGTYDRQVEGAFPLRIAKPITLTSDAGTAPGGFGGNGGGNRPVIRDDGRPVDNPVLEILADDVTVSGMEIRGPKAQAAVLVNGGRTDVEIVRNRFADIANRIERDRQGPCPCAGKAAHGQLGFGVASTGGDLGDFAINDNAFINIGSRQTAAYDARYAAAISIAGVSAGDPDDPQEILGNTFTNMRSGGNDLTQTPSRFIQNPLQFPQSPSQQAQPGLPAAAIAVIANGRSVQIGEPGNGNVFNGVDIDIVLNGDMGSTIVAGNDFGTSGDAAIAGLDLPGIPLRGTVDAPGNWWGDPDGPRTVFDRKRAASTGDFVEPIARINVADPLESAPEADAGGGFGGNGDADGQQRNVTSASLACDTSVTNVSIRVTDGQNNVKAFAALSCDDFFTNRPEDRFEFTDGSDWDPTTSTVTINFFSTKDGQGAFQTVTLSPTQVEPGVSYILATNSNSADIWADLDGDGTFADEGGALADGVPTNKQPTLTFNANTVGGGDGGAFGTSIQHLDVKSIETSRRGFNYTFSVQGQGVASTSITVFDLSGRNVASETTSGSTLRFRPMTSNGAPLANGIYLYQVTVRGHDGSVKSMGVRKMLVLR